MNPVRWYVRLLIIEDHQDILANILEYFTLQGCDVTGAHDGLAGLNLAISADYDAIILDVSLPRLDGNLVCRKIRESARHKVPILMLTARDRWEDRVTGLAVGADDYILKPFSLSELLARVRQMQKPQSA